MDWPNTLPIPLASGYTLDDMFDVIRPSESLGFSPDVRRGQMNAPKEINASLLLTFDEYALFDWLVMRKLSQGVRRLSVPLTFDSSVVKKQSVRIVKVSPVIEGRHWKVGLTLEVVPNPWEEVSIYEKDLQLFAGEKQVLNVNNLVTFRNHYFQMNENGNVVISATTHAETLPVIIGMVKGPRLFSIEGQFHSIELVSNVSTDLFVFGNNLSDGY